MPGEGFLSFKNRDKTLIAVELPGSIHSRLESNTVRRFNLSVIDEGTRLRANGFNGKAPTANQKVRGKERKGATLKDTSVGSKGNTINSATDAKKYARAGA